jgi:uncharacterized repeat protein (TIGR01451 family)
LLLLTLASIPLGTVHAAGAVYRVRLDAAGPTHDGASWNTAFTSIQDALARAVAGDEIWVAAGTYTPTSGTDRTATFSLISGLALYGGFAGTETARNERDWHAHVTILSGDIGVIGTSSDNSYHVVTTSGATATTILDGVTLTGGAANGSAPNDHGGGMNNSSSAVSISNVIVTGNTATYGAGIYNDRSSISMSDSAVQGNTATEAGGMYNKNSSPRLTRVFFAGNIGTRVGGAMQNNGAPPPGTTAPPSNPILINVVFSGNAATYGGAMYNGNSNPQLINVTFSGNGATSTQGGGSVMNNWASNPTLTNTIVWGNTSPDNLPFVNVNGSTPVIRYSIVQGGASGTGNSSSDPQFIDADGNDNVFGTLDDNARLRATSPAIDAGNNSAVPAGVTADMDGRPRFVDQPFISNTGAGTPPIVDMGAYESTYTPIYVDGRAAGANNGTSWADAYTGLPAAFAAVEHGQGTVIYVAAGSYTPGADRADSFRLPDGAAIFGGFSGNETALEQRNIGANPTILTGDIGALGNTDDNSYHVVTSDGARAILDGFTITGGNANGSVFPDDSGGGALVRGGTLILRNLTIAGNRAALGGGVYSRATTLRMQNVVFSGNTAGRGGGMYLENSQPQLSNGTFSGNTADEGAALFVDNASAPSVRNAIFWGNGARAVQGNVDLAYSIVEGGAAGTHILDIDPHFVDADGGDDIVGTLDDDLHLRFGSPAIDAGDNTSVLTDTLTDRDGTLRFTDDSDVRDTGNGTAPVVDIGAYERPPAPPVDAPADLSVLPASRSTTTLTWTDRSEDETFFRIERSLTNGATWSWAGEVGANVTTFVDQRLTCNTPYLYRVRATNASGASAPSNTASATILDCTLDSPASLIAAPASSTSIALRWSDGSDNETGFVIERSPDGAGNWTEIGRVQANSTLYTDGNLTCGSRLFYRVASYNPGATSAWSNIASTSVCPPAAPTTLAATALSRMNVALTWNDASDNESGFAIERSLDGATWIEIDRVPANSTTYTSRGLSCATGYHYHVRAVHAGGVSPYSNEAAVTTASCVPQTIYVNVRATGANDGEGWASAYTSLQDAVSAATSGDQIWVAAGSYRPNDTGSTGGSRVATFRLIDGVAVYGGFSGVETALDQRDWEKNATNLYGGGVYHVVTMSGVGAATVLDGVTISGGSATGISQDGSCAGMRIDGGSPTIRNVLFSGNYTTGVGGALCNANGGQPALENVTFLNNTAWMGGGIANYSAGSPVLTSVIFRGNRATSGTYGGGGIANTGGGTITLIDATFEDNTSARSAGGIYNEGSTLSITRGAFRRNSATYAGAIYNLSGGSATISDTLFYNNNAQDGAGIYTYSSRLNVHHAIFQRNSASISGGGIYIQYATDGVSIHNAVFTNNYANTGGGIAFNGSSGTVASATFVGNRAWYGSGLSGVNSAVALHSSIVWGNTTTEGPQVSGASVSYSIVEGGASGVGNLAGDPRFVDADGADNLLGTADDDLQLRAGSPAIDAGENGALPEGVTHDVGGNPRLVDDPSTPDTGRGTAPIIDMGAYEYQPHEALPMPTNLTATQILRSQITLGWNDQSDDETGFIIERSSDEGRTWTAIATVATNVSSYTDRLLPCHTGYSYRVRATNARGTSGYDAAITATTGACEPTIIYVDRTVTTGGNHGGSWVDAYTSLQDALTTAIAGDQIWVADGTYIPGQRRTDTFTLKSGVQIYGGFAGTETQLAQRDWHANTTVLSGDIGVASNADDNSYHVVSTKATSDTTILDGVTITGGNANGDPANNAGGGLYAVDAHLSIRHVNVTGNAASRGGGIACDNSTIAIDATTFHSNHAVQGGGMYVAKECATTITNSVFDANQVNVGANTYPTGVGGAGLAGVNGHLDLDHVVFSANQAQKDAPNAFPAGGGLASSEGSLMMRDVTFVDNVAAVGGGLSNATANASLQRIAFRNNLATFQGGGFANEGAGLKLRESDFSHNSAGGSGGGMYDSGVDSAISRVTFSSNTASLGGGICIWGARPVVSSSIFTNNTAINGGAVYNVSSSFPTFSGVTVSGNSASESGGAIYNYVFSYVKVRNSILWGNLAPQGPELFAPDPELTTIRYSIVSGGYAGDGNRESDPRFMRDPAPGPDGLRGTADDDAGDLRLRAGSPAVDAGDNDTVAPDSVDLDGDGDTSEPQPLDLAGTPRFADDPTTADTGHGSAPIVDMGAYEVAPPPPSPGIAKLSVRITSNAAQVHPGDIVAFHITVTNTGTAAAQVVTVTTTLPEGIVLNDAVPQTASGGGGWTCRAGQADQQLICARDRLDIGAAPEITVTARVTTAQGKVVVRTEVASPSGTTGEQGLTATVPLVVEPPEMLVWIPVILR